MRVAAVMLLLAVPAYAEGPVSKFEDRKLAAAYETPAKLEDVERCLMDMKGWLIPNVYRQPDRPDDVMLIWTSGGTIGGVAAARVDLHRQGGGTAIKSWMPAKQVEDCAPPASAASR
jgi:hypothetical protein